MSYDVYLYVYMSSKYVYTIWDVAAWDAKH